MKRINVGFNTQEKRLEPPYRRRKRALAPLTTPKKHKKREKKHTVMVWHTTNRARQIIINAEQERWLGSFAETPDYIAPKTLPRPSLNKNTVSDISDKIEHYKKYGDWTILSRTLDSSANNSVKKYILEIIETNLPELKWVEKEKKFKRKNKKATKNLDNPNVKLVKKEALSESLKRQGPKRNKSPAKRR